MCIIGWITPKEDWEWKSETEGDYFECTDYNRIKGNLEYLKNLAAVLYSDFEFEDMGDEKTVSDYPYADEINKLADNLENIANGTYFIEIGDKITYEDNGLFIGHADLNRIETGCKKYYDLLVNQIENISDIPYVCGNRIGDEF